MKQPCQYLIVDDDSTSNLICEFTIKRFDKNAVIHQFTRPREALEFLQQQEADPESDPSILFLDVNMPGMTGYEFLDEMRTLRNEALEKISTYFLSSSIEDFSSRAGDIPMIDGFLQKPISLTHLKEIHQELQKR